MNTCRLNCFIWEIEWINKDEKCCLLNWIVMVKWGRMDKQISKFIEHKTLLKIKKKKIGACVFWAPVFFSKSFGGKIHHIWTDVTYRINKKNFLKSLLNSFFSLSSRHVKASSPRLWQTNINSDSRILKRNVLLFLFALLLESCFKWHFKHRRCSLMSLQENENNKSANAIGLQHGYIQRQ